MDLPTTIEQPTFNPPPQLVNHAPNPTPPQPQPPLPAPAHDFSSPQPDYAEVRLLFSENFVGFFLFD